MTSPAETPWLDRPARARPARLRLFTFPFAGGGAALYRAWSAQLPPDVAVCPVLLPGREARISEPVPGDLPALARAAGAALRPHLDGPFALFGHSMGALVAFELAHYLAETGGPAPQILFASGSPAPHAGRPDKVSALSDAAFVEHVRKLGGTPAEVLANAELLELLLPMLRADLVACERYACATRPPLGSRLIAIGGATDGRVSRDQLEAWRAHTRGPFEARILPGGHFDFVTQPAALLAQLASDLS